jgi:hypothetical protein
MVMYAAPFYVQALYPLKEPRRLSKMTALLARQRLRAHQGCQGPFVFSDILQGRLPLSVQTCGA